MIRSAVAVAVAASGIVAVSAASPAEASVSQTYLSSYEGGVVRAINAQRARYGLRALWYTACPDGYAERWASHLRTYSSYYHQNIYNVMIGCHSTRVAENIARASISTSPTTLVGLWMRSPAHRANILNPYLRQVGMGTECYTTCTTVADFIY